MVEKECVETRKGMNRGGDMQVQGDKDLVEGAEMQGNGDAWGRGGGGAVGKRQLESVEDV